MIQLIKLKPFTFSNDTLMICSESEQLKGVQLQKHKVKSHFSPFACCSTMLNNLKQQTRAEYQCQMVLLHINKINPLHLFPLQCLFVCA